MGEIIILFLTIVSLIVSWVDNKRLASIRGIDEAEFFHFIRVHSSYEVKRRVATVPIHCRRRLRRQPASQKNCQIFVWIGQLNGHTF